MKTLVRMQRSVIQSLQSKGNHLSGLKCLFFFIILVCFGYQQPTTSVHRHGRRYSDSTQATYLRVNEASSVHHGDWISVSSIRKSPNNLKDKGNERWKGLVYRQRECNAFVSMQASSDQTGVLPVTRSLYNPNDIPYKTVHAGTPLQNHRRSKENFLCWSLPRACLASSLLMPDFMGVDDIQTSDSFALCDSDVTNRDNASTVQGCYGVDTLERKVSLDTYSAYNSDANRGTDRDEHKDKHKVNEDKDQENRVSNRDNDDNDNDKDNRDDDKDKDEKDDYRGLVSMAARRLLERARLLQMTASGVHCLLPLGVRVLKKIEAVCHDELSHMNISPLALPNLMPIELLYKSNRVELFGRSLYKLQDRRSREFYLPPTCEEAAAWLASTVLRSHRELPLLFYQIASKFRDEARPRAGCLRSREFVMLEVYSFHQHETCRDDTYNQMDACFRRILTRIGANPVYRVQADPGAMGGLCSHEYHVSSVLGSDNIPWGVSETDINLNCKEKVNGGIAVCRSLEIGHCFKLPDTYCTAARARFTDSRGAVRIPLMNSYGLGVSRLMGHLAFPHHNAKCLSFDPQIAPFCVAVIPQPPARWSDRRRTNQVGRALFKRIHKLAAAAGGSADVLLDDRRGLTLRQMQAHANVLGIPYQIIVKEQLLNSPGKPRVICISRKNGATAQFLPLRAALEMLREGLMHVGTNSKRMFTSTLAC